MQRTAFTAALAVAVLVLPACVGDPDPSSNPTPPGSPDASVSAPGTDGAVGETVDAAPGAPDAAPLVGAGSNVDWLDFPEQQSIDDPSWGDALTDIARHLPASYGSTYYDSDKVTHAHETTHGINSHLRNNFNNTGQRANAFYVLANKAALVVEPDIRKSDVAAYIPADLRGSRYSLYVTGSTAWDDTPLYLWDEWVSYTNGGVVGVDLVNASKWSYGWRDAVMGQLEFTVYGIAVAMAVADLDPSYFASNTQFLEFLAWNTRRAMTVFREGMVMDSFTWDSQDEYYERLRTGAAGAPIRQFIRDAFGSEFVDDVLDL